MNTDHEDRTSGAAGTGSTRGTGSTGSTGGGTGSGGRGATGGPAGEDGGTAERISEGFRQGIGVLSAFKEALEETIEEARDRGELSTDRAREFVRDAMGRARSAAGGAKDRFDLPTREDFDRLREQVDELRVRLENLEQRASQAPDAGPSRTAEDPTKG